MDNFYNICWYLLAQTQGVTAGAGGGAEAPAGQEVAVPDKGFFDNMGYFFPIMMGVLLFYFLLTARPKNKAQAKTSDLLASLKKNDKVVTAGGILGTVVNYRSDAEYVTLRIDDTSNSRMQVLATSIVRVVSDEDAKKDS
ncbi:MAG: preprotein translocase subunit YajC [Mariniblastus sp.]|jgi:preprotein translocase subunit YajC